MAVAAQAEALRRARGDLSAALAVSQRERDGLAHTVGDLERRVVSLLNAQAASASNARHVKRELRRVLRERFFLGCASGNAAEVERILAEEAQAVDAEAREEVELSDDGELLGVLGSEAGGLVKARERLRGEEQAADERSRVPLVFANDGTGRTGLMMAIKIGGLPLCEILAQAARRELQPGKGFRASPAFSPSLSFSSPTLTAASSRMVTQFFNARTSSGGYTPLQYAARSGRADCVAWLVANGVDPNQADAAGLTPLHNAVLARSLATLRMLLSLGAACAVADCVGATPYTLAVRFLKEHDSRDGRAIVVVLRNWVCSELPAQEWEKAGLKRRTSSHSGLESWDGLEAEAELLQGGNRSRGGAAAASALALGSHMESALVEGRGAHLGGPSLDSFPFNRDAELSWKP